MGVVKLQKHLKYKKKMREVRQKIEVKKGRNGGKDKSKLKKPPQKIMKTKEKNKEEEWKNMKINEEMDKAEDKNEKKEWRKKRNEMELKVNGIGNEK